MQPIPLNPRILALAESTPDTELLDAYHDLVRDGKHEDARNLRKHLCYQSLACFYALYLANPLDFVEYAPMHFEMLEALPRGVEGERTNILAPRGAAKSTLMTIALPLWKVCYKGWDELRDIPSDNHILIVSFKTTTSMDRLTDIKRHLESNAKILADFGDLRGDSRWGNTRLETANGVTLSPHSRTGAVRGALLDGHRPSLTIADDLDDAEHALNEEWRNKTWDWFNSDLMRLGKLDGTTNVLVVDTMKHRDGLSSRLKNTAGWKTLEYRAIDNPANLYHPDLAVEARWKEWEKLYTDMTLEDADREAQADAFYQEHKSDMISGVIESWAEQITYLDVRKEVCTTGYYPTMRELQNIAVPTEASTFDMENAVRFTINERGFLRSDGRQVVWRDLAGFTAFLDDAGGKDAEERSFAAVVVVAWQRMAGGREFAKLNPASLAGLHGYVMDAWLERVPPASQISKLLDMYDKALATLAPCQPQAVLSIEERGREAAQYIKSHLNQIFKDECDRRNYGDHAPFIKWHTPRTDKQYRISAIEPAIKRGWLAFHNRLDREFEAQMAQFPHAEHDDGPDALEGALSQDNRVSTTAELRREQQWVRKNRDMRVRI